MNIIKYQDDIWAYEDFLTREECEAIIKVIEIKMEKNQLQWQGISFYESYSSGMPEDNDPDLELVGLPPTFFSDLEKRMIKATADMAGKQPEQMSRISYHSQRWIPGAFAGYHSDNSGNDGTESAFERSRYATFIYLNDDFEGGLLNFKGNFGTNNISIKPKAGMLATFHGGHKNLHEVTLITKKTRYTLGSFWDDKEEDAYPEELRAKWAAEIADVRAYQKTEQKEWGDIREKGLRIDPKTGRTYPAEEAF